MQDLAPPAPGKEPAGSPAAVLEAVGSPAAPGVALDSPGAVEEWAAAPPAGPSQPATIAELPQALLARVLAAALPEPDGDGYLPARAVARICAALSCCRGLRATLEQLLLGAAAPGNEGLRLLCSGSKAEIAWLHASWLPLRAAKFTYQEDRGADLVWWGQGRGKVATFGDKPEEGLEARRRGILDTLPSSLQELFVDFVDSAADLSWVPQRRPGPPLRALRLRCAADVFLGQRELAIAGRAAAGLHLEAPWLSLRVGMEEGAASAAERLQAALELVAAGLAEIAEAAAAAAGLAAGGENTAPPGLASVSLVFKDLALLQVSPACSVRVSLLQLLQRAGGVKPGERRTARTAAAGASLAAVPGRQHWYRLDVVLGGEEGARGGGVAAAGEDQAAWAELGRLAL